jgi:hypothetical protein
LGFRTPLCCTIRTDWTTRRLMRTSASDRSCFPRCSRVSIGGADALLARKAGRHAVSRKSERPSFGRAGARSGRGAGAQLETGCFASNGASSTPGSAKRLPRAAPNMWPQPGDSDTSGISCPAFPAISCNLRTSRFMARGARSRVVAGLRGRSRVACNCLKIVMSPVRVRVSPFPVPKSRMAWGGAHVQARVLTRAQLGGRLPRPFPPGREILG